MNPSVVKLQKKGNTTAQTASRDSLSGPSTKMEVYMTTEVKSHAKPSARCLYGGFRVHCDILRVLFLGG